MILKNSKQPTYHLTEEHPPTCTHTHSKKNYDILSSGEIMTLSFEHWSKVQCINLGFEVNQFAELLGGVSMHMRNRFQAKSNVGHHQNRQERLQPCWSFHAENCGVRREDNEMV